VHAQNKVMKVRGGDLSILCFGGAMAAVTEAAAAARSSNQGHERTPASGPGYLTTSLLYLDGHCRAYRRRNCTRTIFKKKTNHPIHRIVYYFKLYLSG